SGGPAPPGGRGAGWRCRTRSTRAARTRRRPARRSRRSGRRRVGGVAPASGARPPSGTARWSRRTRAAPWIPRMSRRLRGGDAPHVNRQARGSARRALAARSPPTRRSGRNVDARAGTSLSTTPWYRPDRSVTRAHPISSIGSPPRASGRVASGLMPAILDLDPDQLLSTTRAVRKRLDLTRPVDLDLVRECLELAVQAPTGGNSQR